MSDVNSLCVHTMFCAQHACDYICIILDTKYIQVGLFLCMYKVTSLYAYSLSM